MEVDYRELLKKYMTGVGESEGVYFIEHEDFSSEEMSALNDLIKELSDEYRKEI